MKPVVFSGSETTSAPMAPGVASAAEAHKADGDAQFAAGDYALAVACFHNSLHLWPDQPEVQNSLGAAHQLLGQFDEACQCFRQALRLKPDFALAYNNLGNALKGQSNLTEATDAYETAFRLMPDNARIAYNLALALAQLGQHERAAEFYRQALRLEPNFSHAALNLASILRDQGEFAEAGDLLKGILQGEPNHAQAVYNLCELAAGGRCQMTAEELQRLKVSFSSRSLSSLDQSQIAFGLAAVLDRQGQYNEAFAYCREANALRKRHLAQQGVFFDGPKHEAYWQWATKTYDRSYFERFRGYGVDSELPIFIVGMPRSGSTLVEQILASHPDVYGAGEIDLIARAAKKIAPDAFAQLWKGSLGCAPKPIQDMANRYLEGLKQHAGAAIRVTIKTLDNFLYLGLIAALFPKARIIHCRRDPLDIGISCYFQNFRDSVFAWSLEDIAAYYRFYEKMLAHWRQVLPTSIYDVSYEELVQEQEAVTRRLLAHCGLNWNQRCLTFYSNRRMVRTASAVQVRNPIWTRSIGRWKNYQMHLGPLVALQK